MKSKKNKIAFIIGAVLLFAAGALTFFALKEFDAKGYTEAVLEQHFEGKVDKAEDFVKDKSKKELEEQYEAGVLAFVENYITYNVEMEDDMKQEYVTVLKKILKDMKYTVKEAEKLNGKEYQVVVEYQKSDVYQRFVSYVPEEWNRIQEKVDLGEYKGTQEEIVKQMQDEYQKNCCDLLERARQEMEFSETETELFVVRKNTNGLYELDEVQITAFINKIMGLDTNQD